MGTLVFWALSKLFSDYGTWYLIGLGTIAVVVTIRFKQGLWGWLHQRLGWELFPTRRTVRFQPLPPLGQARQDDQTGCP